MQRFDPLTAGRQSPNPAPGPGEDRDSSPSCDARTMAFEEDGPSDGSRLLASLQAFGRRTGGETDCRFHYLLRGGIEAKRLPGRAQIDGLLRALPEALPPAWVAALLQGWPPPVRGLHRIELVPGRAWVSIAIGLKPAIQRRVDAAFAAWRVSESEINVRSQHGFTGVTGVTNAADVADVANVANPANSVDAIVIGAGLAGCALADALTRRGWRVTVLERSDRVGGAVAEIPLLAQHPALSPGEDRRSRLLVAALLTSLRLKDRLDGAFSWCGRFQPMPLAEAHARTLSIPPEVARAITVSDATMHGVAGRSGLWFSDCALADPQQWWRQVTQRHGLRLQLSRPVASVCRAGTRWRAHGEDGRLLAAAPVMILANQAHAFRLAGMDEVACGPLRRSLQQVAIGTVRGWVTGKAGELRDADGAAAGGRTAKPILGGSSYRLERPGHACVVGPLRSDHGAPVADDEYAWRVSAPAERLLLRDNLPMIGAVPDVEAILGQRDRYERDDRLPLPRRDGLYLVAGLGGRGLLWSMLGAEIICAAIDKEPPVIEPDLQLAIDPARFLKRTLQRTIRRRAHAAGAQAEAPH